MSTTVEMSTEMELVASIAIIDDHHQNNLINEIEDAKENKEEVSDNFGTEDQKVIRIKDIPHQHDVQEVYQDQNDIEKHEYSAVAGRAPEGSMFDERIAQDIEWHEINFSVLHGKKQILKDCWGKVESGKICAILGPTGSGKSSLLNVLAGRVASNANAGVDVSAKVIVGGKKIEPTNYRKSIAYVMQDNCLLATSTPRESLHFSAALRLGNLDKANRDALVEQILEVLGLVECADTIIGGELIKGISGGEMKRVSVGIEIITKPSIIFLDEPTSGLDSYTAYNLVKLLKQLAASRATVLFTIHQPSSEIFHLFDKCMFLKEGKVVYQGDASRLISYFDRFGYKCPNNYNPADYVMFICQTESGASFNSKNMFISSPKFDDSCELLTVPDVIKTSVATELFWLVSREVSHTLRNRPALISRLGITILLSILFGLIFLNAADRSSSDQESFASHYGAVVMVSVSSMMSTAQPALVEFPSERPLFMREYSTGTYSVFCYFSSKVFIELPLTFMQGCIQWIIVYWMIGFQGSFILFVLASWGTGIASTSLAILLGCLVTELKQAMEMAPLLFLPQMLFAGFFIRTELIPVWLRWAQYTCSLKYGLNLLLLNEFAPWREHCKESAQAEQNCISILESNDIDGELWYVYLIILAGIFLGLRIIGAISLAHLATRFY